MDGRNRHDHRQFGARERADFSSRSRSFLCHPSFLSDQGDCSAPLSSGGGDLLGVSACGGRRHARRPGHNLKATMLCGSRNCWSSSSCSPCSSAHSANASASTCGRKTSARGIGKVSSTACTLLFGCGDPAKPKESHTRQACLLLPSLP